MDFTTFYTYIYHKHTNTFFTSFTKSPHIYENTTTPHDFTKNTGWVCANNNKCPRELFESPLNTHFRTSTLQFHTKRLKTTQVSLFYLLPAAILADIEIWVSGLEHRDKFKAVVSRINSMYNPIIYAITHELWTPYQNFRVYS